MNSKSVIEEQIRELQKRQDAIADKAGFDNEACKIAVTIADLVERASGYTDR